MMEVGFYSLQTGRRFQTDKIARRTGVTIEFLFPSTGKAFPNKKQSLIAEFRITVGFYSLQPGRRFQTLRTAILRQHSNAVFLFPSTGKAFPNDIVEWLTSTLTEFLFPSNGTAFPNIMKLTFGKPEGIKFLFPSTGKAFPNDKRRMYCKTYPSKCFYSLQPGRRFQTDVSALAAKASFVFLFPSNGTAFPNKMKKQSLLNRYREFLFPSTGTAFPNVSLSKRRMRKLRKGGFYSLQPGRRFQTAQTLMNGPKSSTGLFLFPSTGTAFPNETESPLQGRHPTQVSIPFNRDGVSKHAKRLL